MVGVGVCRGSEVDGSHDGRSFLLGEEVPHGEMVWVGVGRNEEVNVVCGQDLGCEVLVYGVGFVMEEVRYGVAECLRGCDVVFCCCKVGELLDYVEKFFAVVGAVFDAGG